MVNAINSVSRKFSVLIRFDRKTKSRFFVSAFTGYWNKSGGFKIIHALLLPASAIPFMLCLCLISDLSKLKGHLPSSHILSSSHRGGL